jgi:energy-coupling factor transport system substrate-specific component
MYDRVFMKGVQLRKIIILCAVSAVCNAALSHFVINMARFPLYQDTVFTIAMCFSAGLFAGFLTGAFSCFCISFVYIYVLGLSLPKVGYLFYICVIVEVLLVCFFHSKMKKREAVFFQKPSLQSFVYIAPLLLGLVALDCVAMSITGGIIDFTLVTLQVPRSISPEDTFKLGLLQNNVPLLATAILSRIPINIVDRFIAIFCGYGVSLLFRKWIKSNEK